ncbi:ligand-binding sensor domain-containing protein [Undibacterium fentianense]|uniref:diguanylate cyclase n=1 Tax=Undibacterium fentianense TaxID=2828728 RepID=A0A941E8Q1_9BURK|nr:ligand-binding sensor domain-containing diguanylate cyclase [Undibacterium fentianense]MBR7800693.1 diguanylate cyclase [Undibacterium fentianense]
MLHRIRYICSHRSMASLSLQLLFGITVCSSALIGASAAAYSPSPTFEPALLSSGSQRVDSHHWSAMADVVFRHLSTQQGLPQFSATALAQDGEGFIWVGTQGGLARWDGYRFRNYLPIPNDPRSLPDNYVVSLYSDHKSRLWVGTNGGGLARYDYQTDTFVRMPLGNNGLSHVTVNAIVGDGKNGLWLATRGGLNHFDPDTGQFQHYRFDANDPESLPSDFLRNVVVDSTGMVWVATSQGLVKFDVQTQRFTQVRLPVDSAKVQRIVSIGLSSDGKLWIGTFDTGVFYLDTGLAPQAQVIKRLLVPKPGSKELVPNTENIYTLRETAPNEIWLGTYGKGVLVVNTQTLETKRIMHEPTRPSSLADNAVWSILRDRSGLIWVGSQRGLSIHDPSSNAFVSVFGGENRSHGLVGTDFFSLHGFKNGDLWAGSQTHGIGILETGARNFKMIEPDEARLQNALPQGAIFTIYPTRDGQVYIGSDKGLYVNDGRSSKVSHLKLSPRNPVLRVATLLQVDDNLLIGGPEGLWQKDLQAKQSDQATQPEWTKPISNKFITDLQLAPDGAIWVASLQDGLFRYDPKSGQLLNLKPNPQDKLSLTHRNVSSIFFDSRGWLWVATQGGGLDLMRRPDGRAPFEFKHFGKAEKIPNELVNKVLEDQYGDIWASTDEGFARIQAKTLAVDAFVESDGVAITGYWSNSGGRLVTGELAFGGVGGFTVVRPELVKPYSYRPPVVVTNIQLGGKPLAANHVGFVGAGARPIVIQPDANSIIVEFAALDYSAPERNRYAYRLVGYDKDWVETDYSRRLAAYTNLPPGEYRLLLRGSNRNGSWSEEHLSMQIRVLPAWFQTWWAYTLYVLLFALLFFGLVRWRLWRLSKANRTLELVVQERTRELELSRRMLEEQSLTDHLTGLRNRRYLNLGIAADIAQVNRAYQDLSPHEINRAQLNIDIVFMMVDIDYFKSVNDEFGHAAGDQVLIQTTAILREAVRDTDTIIRWGGEEFLIVARQANYLEAEVLAERIRVRIAEHPFSLPDGKHLHRTCSIGLTTYPFIPTSVDAFSWEQVVDIADQCLYAAKHGGRNAWVALFLLGNYYSRGHITNLAQEVEDQIAQGHIVVKTSLPPDSKLDWSHGRDKL